MLTVGDADRGSCSPLLILMLMVTRIIGLRPDDRWQCDVVACPNTKNLAGARFWWGWRTTRALAPLQPPQFPRLHLPQGPAADLPQQRITGIILAQPGHGLLRPYMHLPQQTPRQRCPVKVIGRPST